MKRITVYILTFLALCGLLTSCRKSVPAVSDGFGRDPDSTHVNLGVPSDKTEAPEKHVTTICVDPGHGFGDVGTTSEYLGDWAEKDVTLSISVMLKEELENRGYRVHMLHDGQTIPENALDDGNDLFRPTERIEAARNADIDYYVSVHCDSYAADSSVRGTRVYYAKGTSFTKKSKAAANDIMDAINTQLPDAKKTRVIEKDYEDAYYVIREAPVPSSLIEVGFVTNPTDAANMLDEEWRRSIARGIAAGIDAFFAE